MLLINQALNMFWQAALENSALVGLLIALLVLGWIIWLVVGRNNQLKHKLSLFLALVVALIGFVFIPSLFHASFSDMNYWVDWAFHIATCMALLVYAYLVILPIMTTFTGKPSTKKQF